jgi:glycosyltransferase involved in cell wall biosynthesis
MMRVLSVNSMLDPVAGGGTAERTFQMARFLALAGVNCTVLTLDVGLTRDRIIELRPADVSVLHCILPRYYLFRIPEPKIKKLVQEADVVHLMGHWTLLNALVAREALKQHKPYIVCPAGALPIYGRSRWIKTLYNLFTGRRLIAEAQACVAIAENEFEHFSAYGVDSQRVTLIPNGIDPAGFNAVDDAGFRQRFGLPSNPFILFLGRLNSIKGPDLLLDAFPAAATAHPDMHLVFAGPDGGMLESLRTNARRTDIVERIHFIGPLRGTDKSQAYHAAALLAVPSRQEAMSIVAIEAGICGTPVLITDQCGFNDIGASGGGMVVGANISGLTHGLLTLLAAGEQLPTMGAALYRFTRDHYLWENVVSRYRGLFDRVLRNAA